MDNDCSPDIMNTEIATSCPTTVKKVAVLTTCAYGGVQAHIVVVMIHRMCWVGTEIGRRMDDGGGGGGGVERSDMCII